MKAIVVFCDVKKDDGKGHPFAWLLKNNFKHCFVSFLTEVGWVEIDYRMGIPLVRCMAPPEFDMNKHYEDNGFITVETKQPRNMRFRFNPFRGNIMVANCVGLIKALLGIKSFAITPYQLYKRLKKCQ